MDRKDGKWAREILSMRDAEGLWGNFHTLSIPVAGRAITTEQAIRRLRILGFTKEDEPIHLVLARMVACVRGERKIDGYSEKTHDWRLFERLMLSAWIRLFDPQNETGLAVARQWAQIAEHAFSSGRYREEDDEAAFRAQFGRRPRSGFETGFGMFYHAALLQGVLAPRTEGLMMDYYLAKPDGMYYIYEQSLSEIPAVFASRQTGRYLAALEVLANYSQAPQKLSFAAEWLESNRSADGRWDLGAAAKDGVYLPLSDSWRRKEDRIADCTQRVSALMRALCPDNNSGLPGKAQ